MATAEAPPEQFESVQWREALEALPHAGQCRMIVESVAFNDDDPATVGLAEELLNSPADMREFAAVVRGVAERTRFDASYWGSSERSNLALALATKVFSIKRKGLGPK